MNADNKTPLNGQMSAQNFGINNTNADYITTSSYNFDPYYPKSVVDVQVDVETIQITYIRRAMYSYTTINNTFTIGGPQQEVHNPDIVFKEIYGVRDGKLTLLKTVHGRVIPPKLEETYEFDEE